MSTKLPLDVNDNPIPALRLRENGAHQITTSATSSRNTIAFDPTTRIVGLYATQDIYINFGNTTVSASNSDHFFPGGLYYDIALGGGSTAHYTHIAVLQATTSGTLFISEKV